MDKIEFIKLKCDLLINGLRLNELRKDLINNQGWKEEKANSFLPAELKLPNDIIVQIRENPEANFRLRIIENELIVEDKSSRRISEADFISLPPFANNVTSDGKSFKDIVVYNGICNLNFTWNYFCDYFRTKSACRFCNLTPAQDFYPEENITNSYKNARQIADVIQSAKNYHTDPKAILTRGTPADKNGLGGTIQILEELANRFPFSSHNNRLKILFTISPTKNIDDIKLMYELGMHSVSFNFEVFDKGYWKAIVPGKDKYIGRELWEASLIEAVKYFGVGRVFSALIAGLEPRNTLLDGVKWCAERGIIPIIVPFSPETGSEFEGFRPPTFKWMMDTTIAAAEILLNYLPIVGTENYWKNEAPICAECFSGGFFYDIIKYNAGLNLHHSGHGLRNHIVSKNSNELINLN